MGAGNLFGQGIKNFSAELDANYYYYFLTKTKNNNFNYGFSVILSACINKVKLSSGVNYATKNYYSQSDPSLNLDSIEKRSYKVAYLNVPVLFSYNVLSIKTFKSFILIGIIFNQIINYSIESKYANKEPILEKNITEGQKLGMTLTCGLSFSKTISKHFAINFSPSFNFKLSSDHFNDRPSYRNLSDDKYSFGVKVGVEYFIRALE